MNNVCGNSAIHRRIESAASNAGRRVYKTDLQGKILYQIGNVDQETSTAAKFDFVSPTDVDDDSAALLSHEIAREIEDTLEYPGQVKVTVIRESRAVDVAKNHGATHGEQPRPDSIQTDSPIQAA